MRGWHRWGGVVVLTAAAFAWGGCSDGPGVSEEVPACDPRFVSPSGACDAGAIEGTLRYPDREANAGFRVELEGEARAATTGVDGRFRFDGVTPGTRTLGITTPGGTVVSISVYVTPQNLTDVGTKEFAEDRPTRLTGRIVLEGATDHGGTRVTVVGGTEVALTRADGTFAFPALLSGSRTLRAEHAGYAAAEQEVALAGEAEQRLPDWNLEALPVGGTISGRVTITGTGDPAADATVIVVGAGKSAHTGGDGAFVLGGVPEGTWEVRVGKPGFGPTSAGGVEVKERRTTEVSFRLSPSASASMVAGVAQRLGETSHAGIRIEITNGESTFATTTRADGRWNLDSVPQGLFDLRASWDGLEAAESRGVVVGPGPNAAPELVLGPAIQVADRKATWSKVLPHTRRGVIQFDEGLARFDRESRTLEPLAEGSFWLVATDRNERFMTLARADAEGTLLRLSVDDGVLTPVELSDTITGIWALGPATLVSTADRKFFLLHPESTAGERIDPGCSVSSVEIEGETEALPADGVVVLRARTMCGWNTFALANLSSNFVGFFGTALYRGGVPTRGVSARFGSGLTGSGAWWVDAEAHEQFSLPGPISQVFADPAPGILAYATRPWVSGGNRQLVRVDLDTGATTTLWEHSFEYIPVGPRIVLARTEDLSGPLHWIALDDGGQGALCQRTVDAKWDVMSGTIACVDEDGRLLVFDERTRTVQTWASGVSSLDSVGDGLLRWGSTGGSHLRHIHGDETISVDHTLGEFVFATTDPRYWLVHRADTGARIVEPATDVWRQVTPVGAPPPYTCAPSPSMRMAVCVEPCAQGLCSVVHDMVEGSSVNAGVAPISVVEAPSWAPDESSVAFVAGDAFFVTHGSRSWAGSPCSFPVRGIRAFTAAGARASLWVLADGTNKLCTSTGAVIPAGHASQSFGAVLIPGTASYVLEEGVADLSSGTFTEFYGEMGSVYSLPGGLVGVTVWGEVAELGVAGSFVVANDFSGIAYVGGLPFVTTAEAGNSTSLWAVRDGAIKRIAQRMEGWIPWGDRALIFAVPDALGSQRLSILDLATDVVKPVSEPMDAAEAWWFFDDGLVYRSAAGSGLWLLPRSGTPTRLGEVDEIVQGNDDDALFYRRDGALWSLTPASRQAVLRSEDASVLDWAEDAVLLGQDVPSAAYWYEVRR